nr:transposase [Pararoseomonas baculiformis]
MTVWISPDLVWHGVKGTGRRGRPRVFTDAAIQAVLMLTVLFQLPLRAAQGMAGSVIGIAGLDWRVPH